MEKEKTNTPVSRYTTREIALRLFASEIKTRHLLQAAGVRFSKAGNTYLWDAAEVEKLIAGLALGEVARCCACNEPVRDTFARNGKGQWLCLDCAGAAENRRRGDQ